MADGWVEVTIETKFQCHWATVTVQQEPRAIFSYLMDISQALCSLGQYTMEGEICHVPNRHQQSWFSLSQQRQESRWSRRTVLVIQGTLHIHIPVQNRYMLRRSNSWGSFWSVFFLQDISSKWRTLFVPCRRVEELLSGTRTDCVRFGFSGDRQSFSENYAGVIWSRIGL